jgi:hypothetical protein
MTTYFSTERSVHESLTSSAVDRLASLAGQGLLRFRTANSGVRPGSLALAVREVDGPDHQMFGDNAQGMIRAAPYNPGVGTIDYATGEIMLDRDVAVGKLVDVMYDYDVEDRDG